MNTLVLVFSLIVSVSSLGTVSVHMLALQEGDIHPSYHYIPVYSDTRLSPIRDIIRSLPEKEQLFVEKLINIGLDRNGSVDEKMKLAEGPMNAVNFKHPVRHMLSTTFTVFTESCSSTVRETEQNDHIL